MKALERNKLDVVGLTRHRAGLFCVYVLNTEMRLLWEVPSSMLSFDIYVKRNVELFRKLALLLYHRRDLSPHFISRFHPAFVIYDCALVRSQTVNDKYIHI